MYITPSTTTEGRLVRMRVLPEVRQRDKPVFTRSDLGVELPDGEVVDVDDALCWT